MTTYETISRAIVFLNHHFREQPTLEQVADHVHLSPYHFQRMFKRWAGVSPKKFLQYLSIQRAKELLKQEVSLFDASYETGLSGTSRLHDLFVTIEGMTPGEFKHGGESLTINFSYGESPFGDVIVASTAKGICQLTFIENEKDAVSNLRRLFPRATLRQQADSLQQSALRVFTNDWSDLTRVRLHLNGTPFQLKVWEALLRIPFGKISTYSAIGKRLRVSRAERAIGSAVGNNPVAYLIPCHRVILASGAVGQYRWGSVRKTAMLGWEAAKISMDQAK